MTGILSGNIAVITGGTSGIGASTATLFVAEGADQTATALEPVFTDRLISWQPIPRAGIAADVAPALAWPASDASAFVTGQDLAVDGGITAGRPASVSAADRKAMAAAMTKIPQPSP